MYTLCIAVDQMIFLHFSDMIAASACDLLCNCFFGNTYISYKKLCNYIFVVMCVYIVYLAVYLINL